MAFENIEVITTIFCYKNQVHFAVSFQGFLSICENKFENLKLKYEIHCYYSWCVTLSW